MLEPIYNILGFQYLPIPLSFIFIVVLSGVLGSLLNLIPVMGEEMGWRGYMLTRLIDAEFSRPILISGLIWATWHVPIVIVWSICRRNICPTFSTWHLFLYCAIQLYYSLFTTYHR
ncbi:CPBP family glutamic-type intramembrane protease [Bacillus cereus]